MTKEQLIKLRYKYLFENKCKKTCKYNCELPGKLIDENIVNLKDLYNLDNCKMYRKLAYL